MFTNHVEEKKVFDFTFILSKSSFRHCFSSRIELYCSKYCWCSFANFLSFSTKVSFIDLRTSYSFFFRSAISFPLLFLLRTESFCTSNVFTISILLLYFLMFSENIKQVQKVLLINMTLELVYLIFCFSQLLAK